MSQNDKLFAQQEEATDYDIEMEESIYKQNNVMFTFPDVYKGYTNP